MKSRHPISTQAILIALCAAIVSAASAGEIKPSWQLDTEQIDAHVDSMVPKLALASRQLDPFGQAQDVDGQGPVIEAAGPVGAGPKQPPFAQVVEHIDIVAVMPKQGRILSGGRPHAIGQIMRVSHQGLKHEVEVVAVAADSVEFRNVKTGEKAAVKFKGAIDPPLLKDDW